MASTTINPSPAAGPSQSQGPSAGASASGAGDMGAFARVSMAANQVAQQFPEAANEMRQIQQLVRQATMKAIQQRSAPPAQTPQI